MYAIRSYYVYSLSLYSQQRLVKRFWVALGTNPQGPKQQAGDKRTPEGVYLLDYKKTDTAYYKAIHISYPNEQDRARAQALGVDPGGMILIHGQPNGTPLSGAGLQSSNWTDGCIALLNHDMDELWQAVEPGTLIQIVITSYSIHYTKLYEWLSKAMQPSVQFDDCKPAPLSEVPLGCP